MTSYDAKALAVLLSRLPREEKERRLDKLAKEARGERPCPECGNEGPHDDNGGRTNLAYCCRACGTHFDALPGV